MAAKAAGPLGPHSNSKRPRPSHFRENTSDAFEIDEIFQSVKINQHRLLGRETNAQTGAKRETSFSDEINRKNEKNRQTDRQTDRRSEKLQILFFYGF